MKSKIPQAYKKERQDIYNKRFGVIFNGEDNLKPLITENTIDLSPTASQCADTYEAFIGGGGFETDMSDVNLSDVIWEDFTPDDLLQEITEPVSRHQGVFINVGYNANYEKDSYKVIPYSLCRVGQKDSSNYYGKIVVSPKGWGKSVKKDEVDIYDVYNPLPNVIQAQVDACGGWDNYKGQVFFFRMKTKYTYPLPLIDRSINFCEVEYKMGLYYKSTVDRSFENITVVRHKQFPDKQDRRDFYKNIADLSGVENANSKLIVQDDWDDDEDKSGKFKFDTIKNEIKAEKYKHFEQSSSNFIRKAFKNIPPQLVDSVAGKLGNTSGEDLVKAQAVYNTLTARDRSKIERLFKELFTNYKEDINPSGNWTIKQYALLDDGTTDVDVKENDKSSKGDKKKVKPTSNQTEEEKLNKQAQANLRGSVGGVTGVLSIQSSVSQEITDYDSGLTMLEEIFGFENDIAKRILGNPKKTENDGTVNK